MLKLTKKSLALYVSAAVFLLFLSFNILSLRNPFLSLAKAPLTIINLLRREVSGIIFYHRNYVLNEKLRNENSLLRNRMNALREIYQENSRLKGLLAFKQKSGAKLIAAMVIGRSADSWSSAIIVDKGRKQGVRRGMGVINYLGLVGKVVETQDNTSKILLASDPGLGVSAQVQRSRQEGLVSGTLGQNLIMRYLPEDAEIKVKDVIVTSGLSDAYPKGLLIGTVTDIAKDFSGLSLYALIKPAVNLGTVEEVLIIIP